VNNLILRRPNLGLTSCRGIKDAMQQPVRLRRYDKAKNLDAEVAFRWGCIAKLGDVGTVVNTVAAISRVNNKLEFRGTLNLKKLCPPTWFHHQAIPPLRAYKGVIVRPKHHSRGRNLIYLRGSPDLFFKQLADTLDNKSWGPGE
jgi:hypothetical protein